MMNKLKHIEIESTNKCNLSCSICPHYMMKREQGFMTWNTLKKLMSEIPKDGIRRTCYFHMIGEPLLHPNLIEMINFISEHNFFVSISTNAMLLNEEMSKKLLESKLNEFTLALDSLNEETYNKIRIGGDVKQVKHNIDNFLSLWFTSNKEMKVELQVVVNKANKDEIPIFKNVYGWLDGEKNGLLRIKGYSTFAGATKGMAPGVPELRRNNCGKLNNSVAVLWNGDVCICCRSYDGQCKIGNINETSLKDIWYGEKLQGYRSALRNKDWGKIPLCKDC